MIEISFTDGTQTITLNSAGWQIMEFDIQTPDVKSSDAEDPTMAGGERFQLTWKNLDQVIEIIYTGTLSAFLTTVSALEIMLGRAAERQSNVGLPRVYLQRKLHTSEEWYRSEIIQGRVIYDTNLLHWPWPSKPIHLYIGIRRRFYWEAVTEVQLGLSSLGVSKTTNPIVLYNHTDAAHANYVDIVGSDVVGTLPAAPKVVMIEQLTGAQSFSEFWLSRNVNANPSTFNHIIEAEASTLLNQVPGSPDYTNYSNGYGNQRDIYASESVIIMEWNLTSSWLAKANSQYFHVLAKTNTTLSTSQKPYIYLQLVHLVTPIWTGPRVYLQNNRKLHDLGVIQIPPWLFEVAEPYPFKLWLRGYSNGANPITIIWDFFSFLPTDSWMYLAQIGYSLTQGEKIIYDGYLDRVYGWDPTNGYNYNVWARQGQQIFLHPGRNQRFYFHWNDPSHGGPRLTGVWAMQMHYRPRRLTL